MCDQRVSAMSILLFIFLQTISSHNVAEDRLIGEQEPQEVDMTEGYAGRQQNGIVDIVHTAEISGIHRDEDLNLWPPPGPDELGVRLVGGAGPHEGRLEIHVYGQWGTVCDDGFEDGYGDQNARVVCHMLGLTGGASRTNTEFGEGSGRIWLDDVKCHGSEQTIGECSHRRFGSSNCGHSEDVGVVCDEDPHLRPTAGPDELGDGICQRFWLICPIPTYAIVITFAILGTLLMLGVCAYVCKKGKRRRVDNGVKKVEAVQCSQAVVTIACASFDFAEGQGALPDASGPPAYSQPPGEGAPPTADVSAPPAYSEVCGPGGGLPLEGSIA